MVKPRLPGPLLLIAGLSALGIRAIVTGLPIPAWQPLDPGAGSAILARLDGLALLALSVLSIGPSRRWAAPVLSGLLIAWIVGLQGGGLIVHPTSVVLWLGAAEVAAVAAGAALLGLAASAIRRPSVAAAPVVRAVFGLCVVVFGVSHFAYADFTTHMVPAWLPFHGAWAYLTGAGHVLAGLAITFGRLRRVAAGTLAAMMASFVVLVHLPAVVASRGSLVEVTFLLNACSLCGAAWTVASTTPVGRRVDRT